ncbi:MAG: nucleoside:proton symporter, partial [Rhodospirillales bacterium]|nr:nucleoside:proton symporter [Rhodospirillales bacterium]
MRGLLGIAALLALAWVLSEDRARIAWRTVAGGLVLQGVLALLLIDVPPARHVVLLLNAAADALQRATDTGTGFVFGYLAGPPLPFVEANPGAAFILAFKALPLVLVISALATLMFHWGVLQWVMRGFAWLLRRSMGLGGALALGAAVHIFVGMIEAPLLVRPWLARMQRGELFALMSCGMAGIAGTVMVIYAAILGPVIPNALGNILIASVISTPAALAIAALMVPFGAGEKGGDIVLPHPPASALDAVVKGTADGIPVLVGIAAVLLVTISLVTLINMLLGAIVPDMTLQAIFAWPLRPVMWLIGIPWSESAAAADLMATKTVLNEFVAYLHLAALPPGALSPRARLVMTYALCGFANFGSL